MRPGAPRAVADLLATAVPGLRERLLEVDVRRAWSAVVGRHPVLSPYRPFTLFAVGHDYVEADHRLKAGDELLLFPPVSGGVALRAAAAGEASL